MQDVIQRYQDFAAGAISGEDFRSACRNYLLANPASREQVKSWFQNGVDHGHVSAALWDSIADLLAEPAAARKSAPTVVAGGDKPLDSWKPEAERSDLTLLRVGSVLKDGRYTLLEELGRGGTGRVFKAHDKLLEREGDPRPFVALKALNAVSASDTGARNSLTYEAMRVKKLSHDNIIRVDGFDYEGSHPFITMEYLNGEPLDSLLANQYANGLSMELAWPIIAGVGAALHYAHQKGVIHSDVKPSNVFITRKNRVKVVDFGISRPMQRAAATETETSYVSKVPADRLTAAYAALEQFYGMPPDPADDVYSFALVIYELLTGKYPFERHNTLDSAALKSVPPRIQFLERRQWDGLRRALAFHREQRIKTIDALLRCLAPQSFFRKHRVAILAAAGAATAVAALLGYRMVSDYLERKMLPSGLPTPRVEVKLTPRQQREVDDSLFLADDYLRDLNVGLEPNELAYGLTEGANNVNQILDSVLAIDAGNARARADKARVAAVFLQKARKLFDNGQYAVALMLAREGLKVQPNNLDLYHLKLDLCERMPASCSAN